jgi:hypothetical protein
MISSKPGRSGALLPALLVLFAAACSSPPDRPIEAASVGRLPKMTPDYASIVIPPNIAPLHFSVDEGGRAAVAVFRASGGDSVTVRSRSSIIRIPEKRWKRLLASAVGGSLEIDVFVRLESGTWTRFETIRNAVSPDSIDGFLTYRRLGALYNLWTAMGIYQRNLENFEEKTVLNSRLAANACMNCHTFYKGGTDRWLLHLRGGPGTSMLLTVDGRTRRIDTRTALNGAPAAYSAWHPSGDRIAFSVSQLLLFFHATGENRDVLDRGSDILVYDIPSNTVSTTPALADTNRMEIWPEWSPDGRTLYYCSSPRLDTYVNPPGSAEPFAYDRIRYDLMRIAYDPESGAWGRPETVLSSADADASVLEPRVSPDGRFILVTVSDYSQFPIYLKSADLALVDAATGRWRRLESNSDRADAFHSWSSNGRWIVFASKRADGLFSRPYFSHIDEKGAVSRPFVLPQEDPLFYGTFLENYNAPELSTEAISISPRALSRAAFDDKAAIAAEPLRGKPPAAPKR